LTLSGTEQTVVTDLDEAIGEHMLEEATDELLGGEGATPGLVSGGLFVSESDLAIMEAAEAAVTEGHAKDVRGEILESGFTGADWFGMHDPVFAPDMGVDQGEQFGLFQFITKLGAEDWGESFDRDEKVFA